MAFGTSLQSGRTFDFRLEGRGCGEAGVLVQAAARAQCAAHVGIVHIGECGAAEPDYDEYSYTRRRSRYRDYGDEEGDEDEEEGEDQESAGFTAVTVDDSWQYIDEWRDTAGGPVEFGSIPLSDGELAPAGALDDEPPDSKRLTEASGNEGASYERSYHRAALVLWLRERYSDVLLQAGVVAALPYLKQLTAAGRAAKAEAVALAKRMMESWNGDSQGWDYHDAGGRRPKSAHRIEMMDTLGRLGEAALLERFIRNAV